MNGTFDTFLGLPAQDQRDDIDKGGASSQYSAQVT